MKFLLIQNNNYNGHKVLQMVTEKEHQIDKNMFGDCDFYDKEEIGSGTFKKVSFTPEGHGVSAIGKLTVGQDSFAVFSDHSLSKI